MRIFFGAVLISLTILLACNHVPAQEPADPDAAYVEKFLKVHPKVENPPTLEEYATPEKFDVMFLGSNIDANLKDVQNDRAAIAWWLSYWMRALNDMYRATGDVKYLEANLRFMHAVTAATDDKRGKQLFTGRMVKAWGCDIYAERGRAVFAVHTGIIAAQMLDFLLLSKENKAFNDALGVDREMLLQTVLDALAVHDQQWHDGPEPGAGHYIGMDQENSLENKPLPANRLSAMGWALWLAWKYTGNAAHRDHAVAIGQYIRNRLIPAPDGAYYWPYQLTADPVKEETAREKIKGEDSSHAGLTFALPRCLLEDGQVFTQDDMKRFAKMVLNGIARRTDGIPCTSITGCTDLTPDYIGHVVNFLPLAKFEPEIGKRISAYYLNYRPTVQPLELAELVLWVKKGGK